MKGSHGDMAAFLESEFVEVSFETYDEQNY